MGQEHYIGIEYTYSPHARLVVSRTAEDVITIRAKLAPYCQSKMLSRLFFQADREL